MKCNNIYGYGQLFGYSALEGENHYLKDFVGMLMKEPVTIRFELRNWAKLSLPVRAETTVYHAVMSDFIDASVDGKELFVTFADGNTVVGVSPVMPVILTEQSAERDTLCGVDTYSCEDYVLGLKTERAGELYRFCLHYSQSKAEAKSGANRFFGVDLKALKRARYAYYEKLPAFRGGSEAEEQLYYKCLSVNKVNVFSPEGKIPCMWTTPDRVPHRHMWLWDSVFHALAFLPYNAELSKNAVRAVLLQQWENGFIPHMMNPIDCSDITQPQVLAWGVYQIYQATGDLAYVKECLPCLEKFLRWGLENRDKNNNYLLEWFIEDDVNCKCGESGLDNSPRFDHDEPMDAIDFSCFMANDARYLSKLFHLVGEEDKANEWQSLYDKVAAQINACLWDEEKGFYFDRLFSGQLTGVYTPSAFMTMFSGVATKERAARLVKTLSDKTLFATPVGLPSIAKNHKTYSNDMWRGGVWVNVNYLVMQGLKEYGFTKEAEELRDKTIAMVGKWYEKTGCIFEYFDPEDVTVPYHCERKDKCPEDPDWRVHVHSISDYNWSAGFTYLMLKEKYSL